MANHGPSYGSLFIFKKTDFIKGLDAEIQKKLKDSYDPKLEQEAREYIADITGEKIDGDFHEVFFGTNLNQ
jgi:hypothetical protein